MPERLVPRPGATAGLSFVDWLCSFFSWQIVRDTGATIYRENAITGARTASRTCGGHQPIDECWVKTGEWSLPTKPPSGGPIEHRASIFPHFDVDAPMPQPFSRTLVRDALIQARSVLGTCAADRPEDLDRPERARVLARRVATLTAALAELDGRAAEKPRIRVPYRREPEEQVVDHFATPLARLRAQVRSGRVPPPPPDRLGITIRPAT